MKPENRAIYAGALDSKAVTRVIAAESMVEYSPEQVLLLQREGTLLAQRFDEKRLIVSGEPVRLADGIVFNPTNGRAAFSISTTGILVYKTGDSGRPLMWSGRDGKPQEIVVPPGRYLNPMVSPDGKRLAYAKQETEPKATNIWIADLETHKNSRLTFQSAENAQPVWSPDGRRIAFDSNRAGAHNIYIKDAVGTGPEELLIKSEHDVYATDWSPDGRSLLYVDKDPATRTDVLAFNFDDRTPQTLLKEKFNEGPARLSPDGRLVAYGSDESGKREVYVQSIPPSGSKWQISTDGGFAPRWRSDGKEIFFLQGGSLVAVAVFPSLPGQPFKAGDPHLLFELNSRPSGTFPYDVSPDGQRFIINALPRKEEATSPLYVIFNWVTALRK